MIHKVAVQRVKEKFWRNRIKAIDISGYGLGADIIVDDKYRVKVISEIPKDMPDGLDFYAICKKGSIVFCKKVSKNMMLLEKQISKLIT